MPATIPTPIDLKDGKERELKLSSFGICQFEKEYGGPIEEILGEPMTQRFVVTAIWAGLLWKQPKLTPGEISDILDAYAEVSGLTRQAIRNELSEPILETCIRAGIFKRLANGHDKAAQPPNAQAEKSATGSSPTGTGT